MCTRQPSKEMAEEVGTDPPTPATPAEPAEPAEPVKGRRVLK